MNRKKLLLLAALILAVALGFGGRYLLRVNRYQNTVQSIAISSVDLSSIPDGVYQGSFDADMVAAAVEVTMQGGRMTDIRLLEHKQERGAAAEVILQTMLDRQQVDVETVAGATNSSKVLQKAVENALLGANL